MKSIFLSVCFLFALNTWSHAQETLTDALDLLKKNEYAKAGAIYERFKSDLTPEQMWQFGMAKLGSKDTAAGAYWAKKGALLGENFEWVYVLYTAGLPGLGRDTAKAIDNIKFFAPSRPKAMKYLANLYDSRWRVPASLSDEERKKQKIYWYNEAVKAGDKSALSSLGYAYKDAGMYQQAFDAFTKAYEAKYVAGAAGLASMYQFGGGTVVRKDMTKARQMLEAAVQFSATEADKKFYGDQLKRLPPPIVMPTESQVSALISQLLREGSQKFSGITGNSIPITEAYNNYYATQYKFESRISSPVIRSSYITRWKYEKFDTYNYFGTIIDRADKDEVLPLYNEWIRLVKNALPLFSAEQKDNAVYYKGRYNGTYMEITLRMVGGYQASIGLSAEVNTSKQ